MPLGSWYAFVSPASSCSNEAPFGCFRCSFILCSAAAIRSACRSPKDFSGTSGVSAFLSRSSGDHHGGSSRGPGFDGLGLGSIGDGFSTEEPFETILSYCWKTHSKFPGTWVHLMIIQDDQHLSQHLRSKLAKSPVHMALVNAAIGLVEPILELLSFEEILDQVVLILS